MNSFLPYHILNNNFLLSANRTIFWEQEKALILSDLHIGKSGHFRKNGIGIPQNMLSEDMHRLFAEIQFFQPKKLIIVGDLFHSHSNKEHDLFLKWRNDLKKDVEMWASCLKDSHFSPMSEDLSILVSEEIFHAGIEHRSAHPEYLCKLLNEVSCVICLARGNLKKFRRH